MTFAQIKPKNAKNNKTTKTSRVVAIRTNLSRKSVKRNSKNTNTGTALAADISISGPGRPTT